MNKYIKTYEGLFDFLKKKKVKPLPQKSDAENCNEITEEIIDSMWDIFDKYNIDDCTTRDKWRKSPPESLQWNYGYATLNDGEKVKCGIIIVNANSVESDVFIELSKDINDIIPIINARTGISLNKPVFIDSRLIINFLPYIGSNTRKRGW